MALAAVSGSGSAIVAVQPLDSAPVMVTAPAPDRYVLFSVAADNLLSYQLIHLTGTAKLLVTSQVVLSAQLPFAVFPLVRFTSEGAKMGEFVNSWWLKGLAYSVAFSIAGLNAWLLVQLFRG